MQYVAVLLPLARRGTNARRRRARKKEANFVVGDASSPGLSTLASYLCPFRAGRECVSGQTR